MREMRHMNIVFFYGAGRAPDGIPFLVRGLCVCVCV
jgi:hypothetical protein